MQQLLLRLTCIDMRCRGRMSVLLMCLFWRAAVCILDTLLFTLADEGTCMGIPAPYYPAFGTMI